MADDDYGATIAKLRLARRLAAMRDRTKMKFAEVADALGWSRGQVERYERNEWKLPHPSHVRDLARIYDATEAERAELDHLVRLARLRPWWRAYDDVFGEKNEFAGFENDAARISWYLPLVVPGLLQTRAYMEALLAAGAQSPQWQQRALDARLRRQQILDRADGTAPRLAAVITEASLLFRWGTQQDRRAQVAHLLTMSRRPSVDLRLLRFADGPHMGVAGSVNIYDFPDDDDPTVVYLETDIALQLVLKPDPVSFYKKSFARLRDAALAPTATRNHLEKLADNLE